MLISFTSDGWPIFDPCRQIPLKKKNTRSSLPQIGFIFITNSQPQRFLPSHLSLQTSLRKHSRPSWPSTHNLCPLCSIPASRKNSAAQSWLSSSRTTTHIADLSATIAKHAGKFSSQFKMGFPPKPLKYRKYYKSGSTSDIGHFDHAMRWEMAHNSQHRPFSHPKRFQTFPSARLVHHSPFSPRTLKSALDTKY